MRFESNIFGFVVFGAIKLDIFKFQFIFQKNISPCFQAMFTDLHILKLRDHELFHKVVKDKATIKVPVVKFMCVFPVLISLSTLSNQSYKPFVCYHLDDALHC